MLVTWQGKLDGPVTWPDLGRHGTLLTYLTLVVVTWLGHIWLEWSPDLVTGLCLVTCPGHLAQSPCLVRPSSLVTEPSLAHLTSSSGTLHGYHAWSPA